MKTALVFGASGQLGTPLRVKLADAGWRVLAVSRQAHADAAGTQWLRGDLARIDGLPDEVDAIFSCGPLDLFAHWHATAATSTGCVVAFGSTSASSKQASADDGERDVARRLQEAEASLLTVAARRGIGATILRPTLVYGAGRDRTLSRIARIATRWGSFVLPRGASGLRQPVHVQDLADAAFLASTSAAGRGRAYDLPGGEALPYREMVARVLACLQPPPRLLDVPMPVFRAMLAAARLRGSAGGLSATAVARMRQDLVFDGEPAHRDFGYAPRGFEPDAGMFGLSSG